MREPKKTQPGLLLALICIPIFIGALDLTVVSAVLPHVIVDLEIPLQTGLDDAAWIVTGYLLAYSVSMTFMGRLSDLHGRRRTYLLALVIFAFGSYLVAVSQGWPTEVALRTGYMFVSGRLDVSYVTLYVLIAARMIQAFGAGTMVPVGMALVADLYPADRRARSLGLIAAVDTAGWVVGHLYGGIVVRYWNWEAIFWLNLPVCLIAFLLIWYLLRGIPQDRSTGSMDWFGALLITVSLALLNLGLSSRSEGLSLNSLDEKSNISQYSVPLVLSALLFLGLFLWRQKKAHYPLIDLSLFKHQNYLFASLANFLVGFSLFIAIANVPLFINTLVATSLEQGAWDSGWMLSALTIPLALASVPGGWLSEKRGYRLPAAIGLILAVCGFLLMRSWGAETAYATLASQLAISGIGIGLTMAPVAAAVVNASPSDQRGISSALVIIFRLIGMTIGISSITTYDLLRADVLSERLLSTTSTLSETMQVGMEVTERVISETFVIAGLVAALALIPVLLLKSTFKQTSEVNNEREQ
ncbi:MAG TPA: MFS transporter [Anaerolineales bacterium]|nr:MFS transporter [Anaerolineales bacterium]HLO31423.1 MFS transporter [Anaerolineales bacterium]